MPLVVDALALNEDAAAFLAQSIRGQGILVGPNGESYPIAVVATREEDALVTDMGWLSDGSVAEEPMPDVELDYEVPVIAGPVAGAVASRGLSLERLESERVAEETAGAPVLVGGR